MRLVLSLCFGAALGCGASTPTTQVVTGNVTSTDALGVRAVSGSTVVAATQLAADGSFALALPPATYRLEIVTASGVQPIYDDATTSYRELAFRICHPGDPVDVGAVGHHHHGGGGSGDGSGTGSGGPGGGSGGSGCGPGGPGGSGDHGGPGGSGGPMCNSGSDCGPPPEPPPCGSDGTCTPPDGDGMCPDHPPGDIGCGSGSGSGSGA